MRSDWTRLPSALRDDIEAITGVVTGLTPAPGGSHADFSGTLHTVAGRVFVKAAEKVEGHDGPEVRSLRREAAINPFVRGFTPCLHWMVEAGEWLALGFEQVDGRHADYAPGSPDLLALTQTVRALQDVPCPDVVEMRVERRWEALASDVSAIAGHALLHTDLNPKNVLISADGQIHVVDWAFASRGGAWVEAGQVIPWLIRAGHTPREAETWAASIPSWVEANSEAIDLYAQLSAERWRQHSLANLPPGSCEPEYVTVARRWAEYRLGGGRERLRAASPDHADDHA